MDDDQRGRSCHLPATTTDAAGAALEWCRDAVLHLGLQQHEDPVNSDALPTEIERSATDRHQREQEYVADDEFLLERRQAIQTHKLVDAAKTGNVASVKLLLQSDRSMLDVVYDGRTAMSIAAERGYVALAQELLRHGATVELKDTAGRAALSYASEFGRVEVLQELLRHDTDVNVKDNEFGRNALMYAARAGHVEIVRELLRHGADVDAKDTTGGTALSHAAENSHVAVVHELMCNGAKDSGEGNPIIYAAALGRLEAIQELIASGADVDTTDKHGRTALSYAAELDNVQYCQELVQLGADVEAEDNEQRTVLSHAAEGGCLPIVQMLIGLGVDVELEDQNRRTPLSYAAERGHGAVVEELVRAGTDVEAEDSFGEFPLLRAAKEGHAAVVETLIKSGADVQAKSSYYGKTALSSAATYGRLAVVQVLIRSGADLETRSSAGISAISSATLNGRDLVVHELITAGAVVDTTCTDRRTPLLYAASRGDLSILQDLIKHGADVTHKDKKGRTALSLAACQGNLDVVQELIRIGIAVDTTDNVGQTALLLAAKYGHAEVAQELIKNGAAVDHKDRSGRSAVSHAAEADSINVIEALVENGADVNAKDCTGRTALSHAAQQGSVYAIHLLLKQGAIADEKDRDGKIPISYAASAPHRNVVRELFRLDAFDRKGYSSDILDLFTAATMGDEKSVQALIAKGVPVNCATKYGTTALFYAAECGRLDVVQTLFNNGAWVGAEPAIEQRKKSESPLTVCGRAGHMQIFRVLVEAGAQVNVRSDWDGETPLISAARWDFFVGVQLLISHGGGSLHFDANWSEGEVPLVPGTLETMNGMCGATFEFKAVCSHVTERLEEICNHLQHCEIQQPREDIMVSFASILFRFCKLLLEIEKRVGHPLFRFIASRAMTKRIQDFHEELDYFASTLGSFESEAPWQDREVEERVSLERSLEEQLSTDAALANACDTDAEKLTAAALLDYELRAEGGDTRQGGVKRILNRFLRVCGIDAPGTPDWFISRDDVEFYSWNFVKSMRYIDYYEGKWRKTGVVVETHPHVTHNFKRAATQWHQLSHPNVAKLYGACDIGTPMFFVYELVHDGVQLHEFLKSNANSGSMWQCLLSAALGLQYLHNQDAVHGDLRGDNIIVGANAVVKLCSVRDNIDVFSTTERSAANWVAPEFGGTFSVTSASDIYAFGMCIWEAVTRELPWKDMSADDIYLSLNAGKLPARPESIDDPQWDLITKMCTANPSDRVKINYVVNRLQQFILDSEQRRASGIVWASLTPDADEQPLSLDEHIFAKLDDMNIATALEEISFRCKELQDDGHWMVIKICPALAFIFDLLRKQNRSPDDIEVVAFCAALSRLQRYLRTARSKKSVYQLARSRQVAETHRLVYSDLDRMLDMLQVPEGHSIRVWRSENTQSSSIEEMAGDMDAKELAKPDKKATAVTLRHFDSPSDRLWTAADFTLSSEIPPWHLSLCDLVFNKSDRIGKGSFGTVYKGSWLGTPVVIKFMGYEEDFDTISTDLLLHEVRVWHRLNHPHVLKMYGACHVDKRYFVCELASQGELLQFLKKTGNERVKWQKLYEAALGLQYLHAQNVVHNDLKCDNIMVGMDGSAKLIDFGLSGLLGEAEAQVEVKKMGAVNWRSPEYLTGCRPSRESDVYSFAMCIVEAASGAIPWGHPMIAAQVRFQLKKGHVPDMPAAATEKQRELIRAMAKREPSERMRLAFVVDKLHEIAQDENASERPR